VALHLGHHARGFLDPIQARLAEPCLLRHGAHRVHRLLESPGNELPVATHTALSINKVVSAAHRADALGDLLAPLGESLGLVTRGFHGLHNLLPTPDRLWGMTRSPPDRLAIGVVKALLHAVERLCGLRHGLCGSPLFDGERRCDGFAQLMLHREEVRRVMRSEVLCSIRQQSGGCIARGLHHPTVKPLKDLYHERLPGVVVARLGRLLQHHGVAHRLYPY
jgi:hypothetical protein